MMAITYAKYYRVYPNDAREIYRSLWAVHSGFDPKARPLWTLRKQTGLEVTGVKGPGGYGLAHPETGLMLDTGRFNSAMPSPPDGWEAVSPLSPGELEPGPAPPIAPPVTGDPQAIGRWTAEKELAWLAWCKTVDERLARGGL